MTDDDLKRAALERCLAVGTVLVQVDGAACTGLPEVHKINRSLILRLGYALVPDMQITLGDLGLSAWCEFNGVNRRVQIPWSAVIAIIGETVPRFSAAWPDTTVTISITAVEAPARRGLKLVD